MTSAEEALFGRGHAFAAQIIVVGG